MLAKRFFTRQASDHRSIADRSGDLKQSILNLLESTKENKAPLSPEAVEDILDRFKLWTGNLGALHAPHKRISLESRLAGSPEVQDHICEQLDDLQEVIRDMLSLCSEIGAEDEASPENGRENTATLNLLADGLTSDDEVISREEEATLMLDMVSQCLKALFRIGILVRKATPRDRFERALQQSEFTFPPHFDINYVEERYSKLRSEDSSWLANRLGSANAKRRQFINYVRDHRAKLEAEGLDPTTDATTARQSSKATTFMIPGDLSTSEFLQLPFEGDDDIMSLVSASTAFDSDRSLKLPSLADLGPEGEEFECPICFTLQSFYKEKSWKIHAYRDLKAYVCTSGEKDCDSLMFGDRDAWFSHELKHHYSLYVCKLCGCQSKAAKLLEQHILDDHGPDLDMELTSVIEHGRMVPSHLRAQDCPFCNDWTSILSGRRDDAAGQPSSSNPQAEVFVSLTHFKRHVATHQEQLAIFAVPMAIEDDEKGSHEAVEPNSLALSSNDADTSIIDEETPPSKGATPNELSSTRVYVSNLARDVTEADLEAHFHSTGSGGIEKIELVDGIGLIEFKDSIDARRSVEVFNTSILMGERISVRLFTLSSLDSETGSMHVADDSYTESRDTARSMRSTKSQVPSSNRTTKINSKGQFVTVINQKQQKRDPEPSPSYKSSSTYGNDRFKRY